MGFENKYLTYKEYQDLGGTLSNVSFNLLEFKSRKKIDELTFGRITKLTDMPQEVKLCVFDLINIFYEEDNPIFASDGVGDYNPVKRSTQDIEMIKINIINQYLSNLYIDEISAVYRGADINEN